MSFCHQGSADLLDDELPNEPVDYFLAGVAGREVTPNYWKRVLAKLAELPNEIHSVSRDATIAALPRTDG